MAKLCSVLICMVFLIAACGKSAEEKAIEKQIEKATGGKADVDMKRKGMKITGERDGQGYTLSTGESTEIPEDFPDDIFIYKPSKPVAAMKMGEGFSLSLVAASSVADIMNSYKQEMIANGWSEKASMNMGPQSVLIYEKEGRVTNIAIAPMEDETRITLTVAAK